VNSKKFQTYFFLALLSIVALCSIYIVRDYLSIIAVAIVFSVIFQPVYQKLRRLVRVDSLAALLTLFLMIFIVVLPVIFFSFQIFDELGRLYTHFTENSSGGSADYIKNVITSTFTRIFPTLNPDLIATINVRGYLENVLQFLLQNVGGLVSGAATLVFDLFIFLVAFFYVLKDGEALKQVIVKLSPLSEEHDELVLHKLSLAVSSVMKGTIIISIIQGILAGIGFYIFGLPSPVLWGTATAFTALIPAVGTSIVLVPAIIYMFIFGTAGQGVGLLIWGSIAVGLIDNFLGPRLMGRGIEIHPLLILFSVLGGVSLFGPMGFILGPLVFSLLFALGEIYGLLLRPRSTVKT
jgi:predicted PurR-regulated permease PerM